MRKQLPLIIILLTVFLLRIPSFFEPYWYGDESIRLAVGQALFSGKTIYKDIYDNSPPLLYILFGAGGSLLGVKLIVTLWVLTATAIFFQLAGLIAKSFKSKKLLFPTVATSLFVLGTSTPIFEGNIANGEIFFILPVIAAMYIVFETTSISLSLPLFFLIGLLFSFSTLIKVPSGTDFFAAFLIVLFWQQKSLIKKLPVMTLGFIIPWILTFLWFLLSGSFSYFFEAVFQTTASYVNYTNALIIPQGALILKLAVAVFFAFLLFLKRKVFDKTLVFLLIWFDFALLGTLIGGRGFNHYLIQVVASLSLLLALPVLKLKRVEILTSVLAFFVFILVFYFGSFTYQRTFSYYNNFLSYALGIKSEDQYRGWFDKKTPRQYQVAEFLQTKVKNSECIFIFGDEPQIYLLSGLCPTTRFVATYHLDFASHFKSEALSQILENPPTYVVQINKTPTSFNELTRLLIQRYRPLYQIDDAQIWQRRV